MRTGVDSVLVRRVNEGDGVFEDSLLARWPSKRSEQANVRVKTREVSLTLVCVIVDVVIAIGIVMSVMYRVVRCGQQTSHTLREETVVMLAVHVKARDEIDERFDFDARTSLMHRIHERKCW